MTRRNSPDIERTREQLGDTVGALTARLDAKAQARATAPRLKNRAAGVTARLLTGSRPHPRGSSWPARLDLTTAAAAGRAKVVQLTPEPARQAAARSARTAREQPLPYAAAAGAAALLLAGWLAGRRRR